MTFLSPWWLLLLVPIALMAAAYVVQQSRRSKYAVRFASLPMLERLIPRRPGWRRHLPAIASLFGFVLLALAVARPEMEVRVPRENATVIVAVDVSQLDAGHRHRAQPARGRLGGGDEVRRRPAPGLQRRRRDLLRDHRGARRADRRPGGRGVRAEGAHPRPAHRHRRGRLHLARPDRGGRVTGQEEEGARLVVLLSDGTNTFGRTPEEAAAARTRPACRSRRSPTAPPRAPSRSTAS